MIRGMVDNLATSLRENPNDADGWLRLGRAYKVLGEQDKSVEALASGAKAAPGRVDVLMAYADALMVASGEEDAPPASAIAVLRDVLALQPDNPQALWFLGLDAARTANTGRSLPALGQAADPTSARNPRARRSPVPPEQPAARAGDVVSASEVPVPNSRRSSHSCQAPAVSRTPQTRTSFAMPCQVHHIGVDVSTAHLDTHGLPGRGVRRRLPNTPESHAELAAMLSALRQGGDDVLVVMEASGGCERDLHHALAEAGVPAAIVNPKRVRDFARSNGWLAKTDRVDAKVLKAFGETNRPRPTPLVEPVRAELIELLDYLLADPSIALHPKNDIDLT